MGRRAGWFRPSAHPHIDLQEGAMNVIAGVSNETSQQMGKLFEASSAGSINVVGGVNLSTAYETDLCAGQNDLIVTAYP